jgi:hypothetical protein
MRSAPALAFASVLALLSCTNSGPPGEDSVRVSYIETAEAFERGDFADLYDRTSSGTRQLLDDVAGALDYYGLSSGRGGLELFRDLLSRRDRAGFPRDVRSVTVDALASTVVAITEEGDVEFGFVFEDGRWALDYTGQIRSAWDDALSGTGATISDLVGRRVDLDGGGGSSRVQSGSGPASIDITNGLEDRAIWFAFLRSGGEPEWGGDMLGPDLLLPGGTLSIRTGPGSCDVLLLDEDGRSYARRGIAAGAEPSSWTVTQVDSCPDDRPRHLPGSTGRSTGLFV